MGAQVRPVAARGAVVTDYGERTPLAETPTLTAPQRADLLEGLTARVQALSDRVEALEAESLVGQAIRTALRRANQVLHYEAATLDGIDTSAMTIDEILDTVDYEDVTVDDAVEVLADWLETVLISQYTELDRG